MKRTMKNLKLKSLLLAAVVAFGFTSCSDDDENGVEEGNAQLTVRMTDAPGDYDQVWVDVQDVMIKAEAEVGEEEGAWESLANVETGRYDLLQLTGGVSQLLADVEIPAGYLDQIRLVLGPDNAVVIDGDEIPMATPSAQQSGLKLNVQKELEAGVSYEYLLDFDVDESVVVTGNSGYILKPVIRMSAMANTGSIVGEVHPNETRSLVKAQNASNTISAYTDEGGNFALHGVPAGTYQVTITPDAETGLEMITEDNVEVEQGEVNDLQTIYLE
ncbi:DUF4382 domain-containing protein [Salegentibacter salegens]|uniref:DUF4382 domain-containing protein n=1 Tax=Salegentibacter salegens TaxID=143223 RepID=A0A1M7M5I6_9FLAO|nr:DUF4382 domain-containing protein [Salegentibacter salegens]PRX40807.1 uncharacterized protein DUF4382 [Salegentibacter salegens]SHM85964.1 protein of unknown function [Salegentibacter salegens]